MRVISLVLIALALSSCASVTEQSLEVAPAPLTQSAEAKLDPQSEQIDAGTTASEEPSDSEPIAPVTESMESLPTPAEGTDEPASTAGASTTPAATEAEPATEPEPEPEPEIAETEPSGYTMAMVAANNSSSSCWSVIRNDVYDLTSWIGSHPGGSNAILGICGREATSTFDARHSGQGAPESALRTYLLGPLAG